MEDANYIIDYADLLARSSSFEHTGLTAGFVLVALIAVSAVKQLIFFSTCNHFAGYEAARRTPLASHR